jgi:tripartite-type tricarboxylate transporter receptor subunit TctC
MNNFLDRRAFIQLAALAGAGALGTAQAQSGRLTKLMVPVPAGGGMDACARLLAEHCTEALGTIVVDNRPGGALRIAIETVKRAKADGETLLFTPVSPFTIYPHIYKKLSYDVRTDFVPVSPFCLYDFALGVPGNSPVNTLAEYVAAVKKNPEQFGMYAVPAAGAAPHFVGAQFARVAGIQTKHVPYKGSAPAMTDLIGGHVPAAFNVTGEFVQYVAEKKVKVLATSGAKRSALLPNVPTFAESGFKDMELSEWFGLFAPAKTPASMISTLNNAVAQALGKPEVIARLTTLGYAPFHLPVAQLMDRVVSETRAWEPIVKSTGFSLDE